MKRIWSVCLLVTGMAISVSAQGFYFDIGLGIGGATTKVDGTNMKDVLGGSGITEFALDFGLKAGYGPIRDVPVYIVGEIAGMGHRFQDSYNYVQFNSYLIGPGVIFYPIPLIQLAGSVGFSFVANQTDISGLKFYDSEGGIAWDISAALDFGEQRTGFLLGVKYFGASNTLKVSKAKEDSSLVSVFVKYAFRSKPEK